MSYMLRDLIRIQAIRLINRFDLLKCTIKGGVSAHCKGKKQRK